MTPSDYAAWVQAVGSIAGIAVAIWVPWRIHKSEQQAVQRAKDAYTNLLRDAFRNLRNTIEYLNNVAPETSWKDQQPQDVARELSSALVKMQDLSIVLSEIQDVKRLENFDAVLAILEFRRALDSAKPAMEKEALWLGDHGKSPHVVTNALATLKYHAEDLLYGIDKVLAAFDPEK